MQTIRKTCIHDLPVFFSGYEVASDFFFDGYHVLSAFAETLQVHNRIEQLLKPHSLPDQVAFALVISEAGFK